MNQFKPGFNKQVDESMEGKLPVNVRTINGIDLKTLKLNRVDGKVLKYGRI